MKKLFAASITLLLLSSTLQTAEYSSDCKKPKLKLLKKKAGQSHKKRIVIRHGKRYVLIKVRKQKVVPSMVATEKTKEINIMYIPTTQKRLETEETNTSVKPDDANLTLPPDSNMTIPLEPHYSTVGQSS